MSPFPFSLPPSTCSGPPPGHMPPVSFILPAPLADIRGISWSPGALPWLSPASATQGPFLPTPADSALSHSLWQPCFRPQEASRASEGPLSPSGAGQMEARLRSNNHGNRWAGKSWHFELASGTKGWHTAEPRGETVPSQDQSPHTPFPKEHSDIQRS